MAVDPDFDVVVVGGGPAGSVLASLLAQGGYQTLVIERDIHPRDHVGESLSPASNFIYQRIGFLSKMEDAGFVHKPGACWTSPTSPVGRYLEIRLNEFPPPNAPQNHTYNVERDQLDAMLLRHAHELGAKVLQGVRVETFLFEDDRCVGVRAMALPGWDREIRARIVVDATGRRALLASQLGLKTKDPVFNQLAIYSWFRNVAPYPPGAEGMLFIHFLGLERAWSWQMPLRNGIWSVGVVTSKEDFKTVGVSHQEFFDSVLVRNNALQYHMKDAQRIRPWRVEGDWSYKVRPLAGPGWILVGDALRFVDPIFSTGMDVAVQSAKYGYEAIDGVLRGGDEGELFGAYDRMINDGVNAYYELISLFYRLQNLFTAFAVRKRFREDLIRLLQGDVFPPEALARARDVIRRMQEAYERISKDESNLLRVSALQRPEGVVGQPEPAVAVPPADVQQWLRQVFPQASDELLDHVSNTLDRRSFDEGDMIIRQGDEPDGFYVILSGELDVSRLADGRDGVERVATLGKGDFFGEVGLLNNVPRNATVTAKTAGELLTLSPEAFRKVVDECDATAQFLAQVSAMRSNGAQATTTAPA